MRALSLNLPKIIMATQTGQQIRGQANDLKNDATFAQARREADVRGKDNPIFTGALGIWDGVILHEHEYVPFLDISVAGHNFTAAASGTDYAAVDAFRAILCGQQAVAFAKAGSDDEGWVEEMFDYKNIPEAKMSGEGSD
jgi:N4-gp56 family major capsid protein